VGFGGEGNDLQPPIAHLPVHNHTSSLVLRITVNQIALAGLVAEFVAVVNKSTSDPKVILESRVCIAQAIIAV